VSGVTVALCMHLSSVVYVWLKALHASCCCARVWCVSGVTMAPCMHLSSVVYVWFQALHTSCCSLWLTLWWCSSTSEWHSTASPPVRASCVAMCRARCADSAGHLELHRASLFAVAVAEGYSHNGAMHVSFVLALLCAVRRMAGNQAKRQSFTLSRIRVHSRAPSLC